MSQGGCIPLNVQQDGKHGCCDSSATNGTGQTRAGPPAAIREVSMNDKFSFDPVVINYFLEPFLIDFDLNKST